MFRHFCVKQPQYAETGSGQHVSGSRKIKPFYIYRHENSLPPLIITFIYY
jgi:hypothetical protein